MALGGLAGALGSFLLAPVWIATTVSLVLLVWFSGVLAGWIPEPRWAPEWVKRIATGWLAQSATHEGAGPEDGTPRASTTPTFLFGLANGLLPCGLVYAALGLAVASTGPLEGAAIMGAFGLGTVPSLTNRSGCCATVAARWSLMNAAIWAPSLGWVQ